MRIHSITISDLKTTCDKADDVLLLFPVNHYKLPMKQETVGTLRLSMQYSDHSIFRSPLKFILWSLYYRPVVHQEYAE